MVCIRTSPTFLPLNQHPGWHHAAHLEHTYTRDGIVIYNNKRMGKMTTVTALSEYT